MRTVICAKKIALGDYPAERPHAKNACEVEIELYEDRGHTMLSICGSVRTADKSDLLMAGQCLDHMAEIPGLSQNVTFVELYGLWKQWHNNGTHAGTHRQERALLREGLTDYDVCCARLKELGLYRDDLAPGEDAYGHEDDPNYRKGYPYGEAWLVYGLPASIVSRVKELCA